MKYDETYITEYKQLISLSPRVVFRHITLSMLSGFYELSGQLFEALKKPRIQFLCFHHVFKDEEDDFRGLLMQLAKYHQFISYSEAVERILTGRIDQAYLAISFDDGLKNCLRAAEIMDDLSIKACFFVSPSIINEKNSKDYQTVRNFCRNNLHMLPMEFLSWDDIEKLLNKGFEIGNHTMSHIDLGRASRQQIEDEIIGAFCLLRKRVGKVKHFAWPFGRFSNFNQEAKNIVFESGAFSCASAERGCHSIKLDGGHSDLCLRRDHLLAKWPISHVFYFLAKNSKHPSRFDNGWPANGQPIGRELK